MVSMTGIARSAPEAETAGWVHKAILETLTQRSLYHRNGDFITKYSNGPFDQFSSLSVNHVTNHSSFSLVNAL